MLYKFLVLYLLAGSVEDPAKSDGHYYRTISLSPLVQQHHWTSEPIVIVCDTIDIRQDRLKSALKFWEKLGYTFDSVYYADALGWNDFPQTGHIMNGIWSRSGLGSKGLDKKNGDNNN